MPVQDGRKRQLYSFRPAPASHPGPVRLETATDAADPPFAQRLTYWRTMHCERLVSSHHRPGDRPCSRPAAIFIVNRELMTGVYRCLVRVSWSVEGLPCRYC
jgi:hypothetical protein